MPIVESKLTLLEMEIKHLISKSIKLCQSSFSITPKGFNAIYMRLTSHKLIFGMKDPVVIVTRGAKIGSIKDC